jgi:tRNA(fMet)-specific endonuclease VapC
MPFILDTDHLIVIQRRAESLYERLRERMSRHRPVNFHLTVVSFHEQMMGANVLISRANNPTQIVRGYQLMEATLQDFSRFRVLPFDEVASQEFVRLRQERVRIGTMDLRIAAIALAHQMTVLTRNLRDFAQVPDLRIEDWTV